MRPLGHHLALTVYWLGNALMWGALLHMGLQSRLGHWYPEGRVGYYLGLIAYSRKDYGKASDAYMKAFQLGANAGVINYALGVNSFAAGNNADATKYLTFARQADATAYGDKVDTLLKRMQGTK